MYLHHITEMVDAIVRKQEKYPKGALINNAHNAIVEYWHDKIAIVWTVDDVILKAKERGVKITDNDAKVILQALQRSHDAEQGVHWLTIECAIEAYVYLPN